MGRGAALTDGTPAARLDVAALARLPRAFLYAAIPALASLVLFAGLPARPVILHVIEKLGHPGVFALIALCCLALRLQGRPDRPPLVDYLLAFGVCLALGGATEAGQMFTDRSPALADVGLDARGAICALACAAAFDRRVWNRRGAAAWRWGFGLCGGAVALLIAMPLIDAGAAYLNRASQFPLLFAPRSARDLYFLESGSAAPELAASAEGTGRTLHVPLAEEPFDGVALAEPAPDWQGQRELVVDVTNPGADELRLTVRVDDRASDGRYQDRFNAEYAIGAGRRRVVRIPLAEIASAPLGRRLDLGHIARVVVFRAATGARGEFLLNAVALD